MAVYDMRMSDRALTDDAYILTLFSRKIGALKYGTLVLVDSQTISPSHACTNVPSSFEIVSNLIAVKAPIRIPSTAAGGPNDGWKPPRPAQTPWSTFLPTK